MNYIKKYVKNLIIIALAAILLIECVSLSISFILDEIVYLGIGSWISNVEDPISLSILNPILALILIVFCIIEVQYYKRIIVEVEMDDC